MDILGIGNAMTDIFFFRTYGKGGIHTIKPLPVPFIPGGAVHLPSAELNSLLNAIAPGYSPSRSITVLSADGAAGNLRYTQNNTAAGAPVITASSGGTSANILKAAAAFGLSVHFIGTTGTVTESAGDTVAYSQEHLRDDWAIFFQKELAAAGVSADLASDEDNTGRCLMAYLENGEVSIAASPAAARAIREQQIPDFLFGNDNPQKPRLTVLEGTVLPNVPVTKKLIALCSVAHIPLVLDVATPFMAEAAADILPELAAKIDFILFANEHEMENLVCSSLHTKDISCGINGREKMVMRFCTSLSMQGTRPLIIEKLGPRGSRCWKNGTLFTAESEPEQYVLDATGAGDTFAGAFLSALLADRDIPDCLAFANAAAKTVLHVPGTNFKKNDLAAIAAAYGIS